MIFFYPVSFDFQPFLYIHHHQLLPFVYTSIIIFIIIIIIIISVFCNLFLFVLVRYYLHLILFFFFFSSLNCSSLYSFSCHTRPKCFWSLIQSVSLLGKCTKFLFPIYRLFDCLVFLLVLSPLIRTCPSHLAHVWILHVCVCVFACVIGDLERRGGWLSIRNQFE